jgi:hypothetical protein
MVGTHAIIRRFGNRRPLDPSICSVAIDANALNRDGTAHDALVDRLLELRASSSINLILPKGVRHEILGLRTPQHIRSAAEPMFFTIPVGLNLDEQRRRRLMIVPTGSVRVVVAAHGGAVPCCDARRDGPSSPAAERKGSYEWS